MTSAQRPEVAFDTLAARLAEAARRIGQARAVDMALQQRGDPLRWRSAGLVWPLFAKD